MKTANVTVRLVRMGNKYDRTVSIHLVNLPSSGAHPLLGTDGQARTLRLFFTALIGTPWLLFIEPTRQIVSPEATIAAVGLGMVLGVVAAVGLADVDPREVNDVTAVIITLVCICVATVVVWLIVPHQHLGTMLQFTLAFMWTMPVISLLYHRYRAPATS